MKVPVIEVCVETLVEATTAAQRGADQLELCSNLLADGLTPSLALTRKVLAAVDIPVKVMIRPRAGGFVYTPDELRQMQDSIRAFRKIGVRHFVIGFATGDDELDVAALAACCATFPRQEFTLHKVIDQVKRPLVAIRALNGITNLSSILTSGGANTALEGAAQLRAFQEVLHPSKYLIAAGKITAENLALVQRKIQVPAYHGRRILGEL